MTKLDRLIAELCPDGVEYRALGDFAEFRNNGVDKKKNDKDIPILLLNFVDVFRNMYLYKTTLTMEVTATDRQIKECDIKQGDIFITPSSEVKNEIGMAAVVKENMPDSVYSYHISRVRIFDQNKVLPEFIMYAFISTSVQTQINIKAEGITRFGLTKPKWESLLFPLPPLPVQREIVRILDNFTELTAELEAELDARRKQYEYYRNELLTFGDDVDYMPLSEVCDYADYRGKTPKKTDSGVFLVTAKNIRKGYIDYETSKEYVALNDYDTIMRRGKPQVGDVLITTEAPCGHIAQLDRDDIALAQRVIKYRGRNGIINNTFLKHILLANEFQSKLLNAATGGTVKGIKGSKLHKLTIPVPSLKAQMRISDLLNRFDTLTTDISSGLPAEIAARQKQYEYYRDKLLNFKDVK